MGMKFEHDAGSRRIESRIPSELVRSIEALKLLPYVVGDVCVNFDDKRHAVIISLNIHVDIPSKGPVFNIHETEPIDIFLFYDSPFRIPCVVPTRDDFPSVPHLIRLPGERHGMICLTRQLIVDWWHGKTLEDVVLAVYRWLTDAAAGELVKSDDPFEPLIVDGSNSVIELDFDTARKEACKHGGIWDTAAREIPIPHRQIVRLVIDPKGNVPTRLWYQSATQATPWIDIPVDIDGVLKLAIVVGFDAQKVRYWIEKGGERNNRVLTVFGVKRPKQVMGQVDSEEWVSFDFHRQSRDKEWIITSHLVLRRFDQELARQVSGFDEVRKSKRILVIGAGALGSSVCDLLVRSGMIHLTIVDNETLRPHNLARHTLTEQEIGQAKALAVAEQLNRVFGNEEIAFGKCEDILRLSDEDLKKLLNDAACILDCSASVAVQHRLATLPDRRTPLICAFQIVSGEGTVMLVEDSSVNGRSDVIEAAMMMRERNAPLIIRWLTEKTIPLALGGGCSSGSARIPDTRVKIGAAWVADCILQWLATDKWPSKAMYGIQKNSVTPNPMITTEWKLVDIEPVIETTSGWRVFILTSVIDDMKRFAQEAGTVETGGILVGRVNRQLKIFYVCEAWSAPPDSVGSTVDFTRGRRKLVSKLAILEANSGNKLIYVGEWHAHPPQTGTQMSEVDSITTKDMAKKLLYDRIPALCVIIDHNYYNVYVVEDKSNIFDE